MIYFCLLLGAGFALCMAGMLWSNPTGTVPSVSVPFADDKVYWPLDPSLTADTIYGGEMLGMLAGTGFAHHFDDSAPMVFLGTKEGITHRLQTDTPAADFKELIRRPYLIGMPLASGTASIPASIGLPAYAADSGHVQLTTAGLTNNNLVGMVVDVGRSQASTAGAAGILTLTGAPSVFIAPAQWGALRGLVCQGIVGQDQTAAATAGGNAPGLIVNSGRGGNTTGTGASPGGNGAALVLTGGAGGNATAGTGNGGTGGSIQLQGGGGGTSAGGSAGTPGTVQLQYNTAPPAGGSDAAFIQLGSTAGFGLYFGSGAPTVSAAQGSLYLRTDGSSTSTRFYVNTNGATTWTDFTSAA